jgi:uncharacterized membrane protein YfcA
MIPSLDPLYSATGFSVGMLVGMTGVGGGSLMTPLLILLFGITPAAAVGTDLLYAAVTKTAGSFVHGLSRTIDWLVVRRLATGSVPMTIVTMLALGHLNIDTPETRMLMTVLLTGALFTTAAALVFRNALIRFHATRMGTLAPQKVAALTIGMGGLLGVLVSASSVGAGAIGVTALLLLYPQLPTARIVGSDIAHAVPLTLAAGIGHWILGSVDWHIFLSLIIGSVPGIVVGSYLAVRVPETALRFILAGTLVVVATKLSMTISPGHSGEISASVPQ